MTLEEVLKEKFPKIMKRLDRNGCWNYTVHGPIVFDDTFKITVYLSEGKRKEGKRHKLELQLAIWEATVHGKRKGKGEDGNGRTKNSTDNTRISV